MKERKQNEVKALKKVKRIIKEGVANIDLSLTSDFISFFEKRIEMSKSKIIPLDITQIEKKVLVTKHK